MTSFEQQSFQSMLQAGNAAEALQCLLRRPVLFCESLWPELAAWSAALPPDMRDRATLGLEAIAAQFQDWKQRWCAYPFGPAPIDAILLKLRAGEINQEQAEQMAGSPDIVGNLSPLYVRARMMQYVLQSMEGATIEPYLCQRVIVAAVKARRSMVTREQKPMERIVAIEHAAAVKEYVHETADGRCHREVVTLVLSVANYDSQPWGTPGQAEYALGQLFLDPYIYGRNSLNFMHQIEAWRRLPLERAGARGGDLGADAIMPPPLDAFTQASRHFLASADLETGSARGLSLKAFIEAEVWKKIAGGATAPLAKAAAEATQLLEAERYTEVRAAIHSLLRVANQGADGSAQPEDWSQTARELTAADLNQMVERQGLAQTTDLMIRVAEAVAGQDPVRACTLWRRVLPFMLQRGESTLGGFLQIGLAYITRGLGDERIATWKLAASAPTGMARLVPHHARTASQAGTEIQKMAGVEHWPPEKLVAALLSVAVKTQAIDRELDGIQLVKLASSVDPRLAAEWKPLLLWFTAMLYRGEASNQFKANNYDQAIRAYALCALFHLEAELPGSAMSALDQAADLVKRDPPQVDSFVRYFEIVFPELERQGGNDAVNHIRDLGRAFLPNTFANGRASSSGFVLLGMLKGVLFSAARRAGGKMDWIADPESRNLLLAIEKARRELPAGVAVPQVGGLDLGTLLMVFAEETETVTGDGPQFTLHNLQVRYDQALRRAMSLRKSREKDWVQTLDTVTQALPPETVLLDYYSGNLPNGHAGLYVCIVTHDSATVGQIDFGVPGMRVFLGEGEFEGDFLALGIKELRDAIQKEPESGDVSNEGRGELQQSIYVAGPTEDILKRLRQEQKWHICVVPHGPLHFLPFHLLPYDGGLLGDQWAITYLPARSLLAQRAAQSPSRPVEIASFGIEFGGGVPHGLDPIEGAEEEARRIAAIFGEEGQVGPAATESALKNAFSRAKRIHISTHGSLTVSAPSFQCVFLMPDQVDDGIMYAWELLQQDLSGVDLLTLSACETALGRIDKGDNLRGIAAHALIAGASTVIGTLWPVRSEVTQVFFEALYREIKGGSAKREAFQTAQLTARQTYAEYRDWGAFWYMGLW